MRPFITGSFLLLLVLSASAQDFSVQHTEEANPHFPTDIYTFPILQGPNEKVLERINSYLIKSILDINYGDQQQSIFENIWQTPDAALAPINYLSYQVEMLTTEIYSVTLTGEFCAAYCEGFDESYSFDLNSGKLLTLDTLLSDEGRIKLLSELSAHKKAQMDAKQQELCDTLGHTAPNSDNREYWEEMLELYSNCDSLVEDLSWCRFIPSSDSLKIIYGRCSLHYNRNVDELWYFEKQIALKDWESLLSPLGRRKLRP